MSRSIVILQSGVPAFMAMLFGAIFTILLLPAYGQQEVDPTWYDPWAPNTATVHSAQLARVVPSSQSSVSTQQTVTFVSPAASVGKPRAKNTKLDQSRHIAAHKSDRTPSADIGLPEYRRTAISNNVASVKQF